MDINVRSSFRITNKNFIKGRKVEEIAEVFDITKENASLIIDYVLGDSLKIEEVIFNAYVNGDALDQIGNRYRITGPTAINIVKRFCNRNGVDFAPLKKAHDSFTTERLSLAAKKYWETKRNRVSRFFAGQLIKIKLYDETVQLGIRKTNAKIIAIGSDTANPALLVEYPGVFGSIQTFITEDIIIG